MPDIKKLNLRVHIKNAIKFYMHGYFSLLNLTNYYWFDNLTVIASLYYHQVH